MKRTLGADSRSEAGHLPLWVKVAYGSGAGGWVLVDRLVMTWLYYFYVSRQGGAGPLLLPLAFAVIMLAGRLVDAVSDPVVARLSDNHDGRMGRRVPFMAVSGVLYVGTYVALFHPPSATPSAWNGVHLAVVLAAFFVFFTGYVSPYLALIADLSPSTVDRVDLTTSKALFTLVGSALGLVGSGLLVDRLGFTGMVWVLGAVGLALLYVPVLIPERRFAACTPSTLSLRQAVRTALGNRAFLVAMAGVNVMWFGFNLVTLNVPLYVTSLMGLPEGEMAKFMGAVFGVTLLAFPAVNALTKRHGLKAVMVASLLSFAAVLPLIALMGHPLLGMDPVTAGLVVMGLTGIPLAGLFIVPDAIVAAVSSMGRSGEAQPMEAMYFGVQGFFLKVNLGLSTVLSAALLQVFGDPLGIRLTGPLAAAFLLAGALVFARYPEHEVERGTRPPPQAVLPPAVPPFVPRASE